MKGPGEGAAGDDEDALDEAGADDAFDSFLRAAAHIEHRAPEPDRAGERLGPYLLGTKLGQGGMGVVFDAEDTRLGRRVALKVVRHHAALDARARRRLVREARSAALVAHPAIATVFEVGEIEGEPFVAMELVDGTTLRQRLAGGPLPIEDCVRIALAIAEGIGAAHAAGIVHRDLKPENVMIARGGAVKLLDFGLAKRHAGEPSDTSMTGDRVVGTAHYMAPEQAKGGAVGPAADVFALGVVLFEMLAGRRPFEGATSVAVAIAIDRDAPPALAALCPGVPHALAALVARCLSKDPADRPSSGAEVAATLGDLDREGASGGAVPGAPRGRGQVFVVGVLAVLAAVAGTFLATRGPVASPAVMSPAVAPRAATGAPPGEETVATAETVVAASAMPPPPASASASSPRLPARPGRSAAPRGTAAGIDPLAHQK